MTIEHTPTPHRWVRSVRIAAGLAAAIVIGGVLAGCGSSASSGGSASGTASGPSYGSPALQLSWIENNEFSGEFIADQKGYYTKEGFSSVKLLSGGPSVASDSVVAAGKALMGLSSPDMTASAILHGANLVVVAALYQQNPYAIMSMAKTPITTPQQMIGKRIGVQSVNESIWRAFLRANHIPRNAVKEVPVQDDPTPLTVGTVDGWFSYYTNEPNLLRAKGFKVSVMRMQDFHYPLVNETYMVRKDTLAHHRDEIEALLRAEILGWKGSLADPALGPHLAVTKYGKNLGLNEKEQTNESISQNDLIRTKDTEKNGILTVTPALQQQTVASLALGGIQISPAKLFDMSLINDIYRKTPSLKKLPAATP